MKYKILPFVFISLLTTNLSLAEEPKTKFEIDFQANWIVLGASKTRTTGGLMPSITGQYIKPINENWFVGFGGNLGIFGIGGDSHWLGVLAGPVVQIGIKPTQSITVALEIQADFGRIPICNSWGLCLRYEGFFPEAKLNAAWYATKYTAAVGGIGIRYIHTLGWSGVSVEPEVMIRIPINL